MATVNIYPSLIRFTDDNKNDTDRVLFKLPLPEITNCIVSAATLSLYCTHNSSFTTTIAASTSDNANWNESSDYSTLNGLSRTTNLSTKNSFSVGNWYSWDIYYWINSDGIGGQYSWTGDTFEWYPITSTPGDMTVILKIDAHTGTGAGTSGTLIDFYDNTEVDSVSFAGLTYADATKIPYVTMTYTGTLVVPITRIPRHSGIAGTMMY